MNAGSLIGKHEIQDLEGLSELASVLATKLLPGDVVLMEGDLGAGKTTFTQFLGKALGVQDAITSPTYTLVGEYAVPHTNGDISNLVHIDLYRTGDTTSPSVLSDEYIQEILGGAKNNGAVVVIEWGEMLSVSLINRVWRVRIESGSNADERLITIYT